MAIQQNSSAANSVSVTSEVDKTKPQPLDASKLAFTPAQTLKALPDLLKTLSFGITQTDYMLVVEHDPATGWSTPEIKPYAPLPMDPMSSCFHYCPNVFEGMKAYLGPDGKPRIFRPELNMQRLKTSAARVALPPFDESEVLKLIKKFVQVESRWIPNLPGYSLYLRPTIIGTRPALGVHASDHSTLFVIATPAGPYFPPPAGSVSYGPPSKGISLLAVSETVRAWPGGTGGHKLGLNYAPGFLPQRQAMQQGYDQILWLFGPAGEERFTEVGAMNVFVVVDRDDGGLDVYTPTLDGTILPGITRRSTLELLDAHTNGRLAIPGIKPSVMLHTKETTVYLKDVEKFAAEGRLREIFGVGTAVVVCPVSKIGFSGRTIEVPGADKGLGPVGVGLWQLIGDIQCGKVDFEGWCEVCE